MQFKRKIVVITGAANKFGQALADRFIEEGARVVISDISEDELKKIALRTGATAIVANFRQKTELKLLVDKAICIFGRIDVFISNAIIEELEELFLSEGDKAIRWHLNVMAQMYAAKYVLPQMINRGSGYFVNTIPANGLLDEFHLPFYSTIKHPALSFAERLAAAHKNAGIKVSVLCVSGIKKPAVPPSILANRVIDAIRTGKFIISPGERTNKFRKKIRRNHCTLENNTDANRKI